MISKIKILFFLLFSTSIIFGRNSKTNIDSLVSILPNLTDTTKINTLFEITKYYKMHGNISKAKDFCVQEIDLAKKEKNVKYLVLAYYQMGGDIYNGTGDFSLALDYLLMSFDLIKKTSNSKLLYNVSNSLGNTYIGQKNYKKALDYYNKAFEVASGLKDTYGISIAQIGKGNVYMARNDFKNAIDAFSIASNGFDKTKFKYEYAIARANIANVYIETNEIEKALMVLKDTYQMMQELDNKYGMGSTMLTLGTAYFKKGNYEMALDYYYKSVQVFEMSSAKYDLKEVYKEIANTYNKQNKNDSAYHYMQLYSSIKDSIFSEENSKLIAEMQTKYESVKKEEENKSLLAINELSESKIKQQNKLQIVLSLFLGTVFIFAVFLFRSNKQKQKKNQVILLQKEKVEGQRILLQLKNNEIVDSITYAKRLQDAILPPVKTIKRFLPESFVLYLPKDIVAGDFYWMETVKSSFEEDKGDVILIAAADCTGHGVPGAIVSVVCSGALNRAVKEFGITEPGKILDKVRELVVETFVRADSDEQKSEVKDGMDISLISIETGVDKKINIKWAGAYNPLWVIRNIENESVENEVASNTQWSSPHFRLIEIKANKQPIGKTDSPLPFTTHSLELNKGDQFYLFTDGYADQFGGANEKKFKSLQLKEVLLANANLPMSEQKKTLDKIIENWKGNLEQVDDILIMGIRI